MSSKDTSTLADKIDEILPQTQCEQCGYHGCRPYAEAIANGEADINRCPPGGAKGIATLATLMGREVKPLDPDCGIEKPRMIARIVEADCIGCTKCIQVCPTDAIVGAAKRMHTVIDDKCTGCELCVDACPVDCIPLDPMPINMLDEAHKNAARVAFNQRQARQQREKRKRQEQLAKRKAALHQKQASANQAKNPQANAGSKPLSHDAVQAAIERARAKRADRKKLGT